MSAPPKTTIAKRRQQRIKTTSILPPPPLALVINLKRRGDRLRELRKVLREAGLRAWERIDAVDGRELSWASAAPHLSADALAAARWAERSGVPTICRKTGSFSPHLTLSAVGCALSHRKAWARLAASREHEWALILEDDVSAAADDLELKLERTIASLPSSWQLCYVGFHESTGVLLGNGQRLRLAELGEDEGQTGLFGYLLRRSAAAELLAGHDVFPLEHQVDVQLGTRRWRVGSRFALSPDAVLLHSPKSEEGHCDTDVQSLSDGKTKAHGQLPKGMLVI